MEIVKTARVLGRNFFPPSSWCDYENCEVWFISDLVIITMYGTIVEVFHFSNNPHCFENIHSFSVNCSSSLLSARLKAFKMSLDQVEVVTKLLRASRNCNEPLLKDCFKEILENGITGKDLNSTDKSGRVSQTFIRTWNESLMDS